MLQQMAVTDKSVYLDTTNENGPKLMNSGKVAMLVTGPWDLSSLSDIDYGVQVMPTFAGSSGGHQTIAGPDNWVVFDNGDKQEAGRHRLRQVADRARAGQGLLAGAPATCPIRTSVGQDQAVVAKLDENCPASATSCENLSNVKKVRPTVEQYPDDLRGAGSGDRVRHARQGPARRRAELRGHRPPTRRWPRSRR